ncbi:hypothetical protein CBR_g49567 [Chara braunii]|uniref:Uncharacterized protein n=1 Tax=Chara braunii TaxID=69332 RepID=A0A388M552_CHABU|nr:hypothetical protein CBR_g49567 [Chara braunii]|eukprot:GBG89714.1 hypothetical protein CBR_g49567 [Chara braunii]
MLTFLKSPGSARWRPSGSADTTGALGKVSISKLDRPELAQSPSVRSEHGGISTRSAGPATEVFSRGNGRSDSGPITETFFRGDRPSSGPVTENFSKGDRSVVPATDMFSRGDKSAGPSTETFYRGDRSAGPSTETFSRGDRSAGPSTETFSRGDRSAGPSTEMFSRGDRSAGPATETFSRGDRSAGPATETFSRGDRSSGPSTETFSRGGRSAFASSPGAEARNGSRSAAPTPRTELSRMSSLQSNGGQDELGRGSSLRSTPLIDLSRPPNPRSSSGPSTEPIRLPSSKSRYGSAVAGSERSGPSRTISIQASTASSRSGDLLRTRSHMSSISTESMDLDAEEPMTPTTRALLAREVAELALQQRRVPEGMRDLQHSFEKGQAAAGAAYSKIADELGGQQGNKRTQLGTQMLQSVTKRLSEMLKNVDKIREEDVAEAWRGCEASLGHWTARENEMQKEKTEVRKMAALFKQAHDDATRMVDEARLMAQEEIGLAREKVRRAEEITREVLASGSFGGKDQQAQIEELKKELIEARRIKMLHQPTMVSHLELQVAGMEKGLMEKAQEVVRLRREIDALKNPKKREPPYRLEGLEFLGSTLYIMPSAPEGKLPHPCDIQWYRIHPDGKVESIVGATTVRYAPEPYDVGAKLRVTLKYDRHMEILESSGPLDPSPGLEHFVDVLQKYGRAHFNCVVLEQNSEFTEKRSVHVLEISKDKIKLRKGRTTKVRDLYSPTMQLSGATGGGDMVSQTVLWQTRSKRILLKLESERERNAAIQLARRFLEDHVPPSVSQETDESSGVFAYTPSESGSMQEQAF